MTEQTSFYTPKQFAEKHPAFPLGGLRHLIFNERKNGLGKSGAIIRIGGKVLIDEALFFEWVKSHSARAAG